MTRSSELRQVLIEHNQHDLTWLLVGCPATIRTRPPALPTDVLSTELTVFYKKVVYLECLNVHDDHPKTSIRFSSNIFTCSYYFSCLQDVSSNHLGALGCQSMCDMLQNNVTLLKIDLSDNGFSDKDTVPLLEAFKVRVFAVLEITVGHRTLSHQNPKMSDQF